MDEGLSKFNGDPTGGVPGSGFGLSEEEIAAGEEGGEDHEQKAVLCIVTPQHSGSCPAMTLVQRVVHSGLKLGLHSLVTSMTRLLMAHHLHRI